MNKADDPTALEVAGRTVSRHVVSKIQKASSDTGVSFSYLMAQAGKESAFQANAGSRASSAAGLFQFTRSTWLSLIKRHGAQHGLGEEAQAIHKTAKGEYAVDDAEMRQRILDLRRDPALSASLAAEYANENKASLERALGRTVNSSELYLAHFLGPAGATRLLKAKDSDPAQSAAAVVPQAAGKNPSVFYEKDHTARSVAQVYERIHHAIDKPMRQYASLESPEQTSQTHHGRHHGKAAAAAKPDLSWPFETGKWPPPPSSVTQPTEDTTAQLAASTTTASLQNDDSFESADRVSRPMPPPLSAKTGDGSAFGRFITTVKRNIFG